MPDNPNYTETAEGWERNTDRQVDRSRVDWDRLSRLERLAEEIRRAREERNRKFYEERKKKSK